jgi:glucose-1-phosphate adenylyltransferase
LTAEQRPTQKSWFQGTADAVRQNLDYLLESPVEYFLILSGDQLYNMDFHQMMAVAQKTDADVVVAALPVTDQEARRMGILKVNQDYWITDFHEKPQDPVLLDKLCSPSKILEQVGVTAESKRLYLGSMGIYLFKRQALINLLLKDLRDDFGKHLIPTQVTMGRIVAFLYDGYWEDIGTIDTFYQANIMLTHHHPSFSFYNEERPIFTCRYDLPPAKFFDTHIKQAILCEGTIVEADEVSHSILGPRSIIRKGSIIRDSYVMGNDYYEALVHDHPNLTPYPQIGENCIITQTIVDKNVTIGKGVQLINKHKLTDYNGDNIYIRHGIIIVPRGATIPDGFIL